MLKDITLGQYFPGDTLAHRLDPRTKLLATVLYIIAIFLAKGPIAYGVLILTLIVWPPENWASGVDTDWRLVLLVLGLIAAPAIAAVQSRRWAA